MNGHKTSAFGLLPSTTTSGPPPLLTLPHESEYISPSTTEADDPEICRVPGGTQEGNRKTVFLDRALICLPPLDIRGRMRRIMSRRAIGPQANGRTINVLSEAMAVAAAA